MRHSYLSCRGKTAGSCDQLPGLTCPEFQPLAALALASFRCIPSLPSPCGPRPRAGSRAEADPEVLDHHCVRSRPGSCQGKAHAHHAMGLKLMIGVACTRYLSAPNELLDPEPLVSSYLYISISSYLHVSISSSFYVSTFLYLCFFIHHIHI